jgi:hypothetical protein
MIKDAVKLGTLTFDLHPLYSSILRDGSVVRKDEVLGLDGDLRRVLVAPFDGVIRLLVTGEGPDRRVKVFLSEQPSAVPARRRETALTR